MISLVHSILVTTYFTTIPSIWTWLEHLHKLIIRELMINLVTIDTALTDGLSRGLDLTVWIDVDGYQTGWRKLMLITAKKIRKFTERALCNTFAALHCKLYGKSTVFMIIQVFSQCRQGWGSSSQWGVGGEETRELLYKKCSFLIYWKFL